MNNFINLRTSTIPLFGLISAEFLSLLGNQIAAIAIPILILQQTQSPLMTGIASAANIIPILMAAFVGGRAIDRLGAWSVSIIADLLSCISVLTLPLAFIYLGKVSPSLVFLLVFVGALFDPSGIAARQTLVPRLARFARKPLEKVNTLRGGLENGADFVGQIVGVGLIGTVGTINAFFVNAASFLLCAIIFILAVPKTQKRLPASFHTDILLGIRFIFGNSQLRSLALIGMIANFVILPFLGLLLPVLTTQVFNNPTLLGACLSAFGINATLGALSFSWLSRLCSRSLIFYGRLLVSGVAIALCGFFTTQPSIIIILSAFAGLLLGAGNPLEQTILQEETPQMLAGQVFTSLIAISFAAVPLGLLLAGAVTQLSSVETVLGLSGGLLMIAAIVGWSAAPFQKLIDR
ncbi:MFS transporter [Phormidesmis priestleyi ULC007]|uniref:MFS transporter n=1 Tax=Phormidesmis priestleyi ULC007 TaxID=1920490 RepID=A0A2T1DG16_9CYAN|nr:MFS transporter [Phormidesmis priestleyi]PSB19450.1 MFS transporter [Phormidesmis priestleyi ULC007]PZO53110.1 MAG: MFS transporter [Phormidesmis priestleyi]